VDPERGVVRRMPLLASVGGTLAPVLGLEMLRVAANVPALAAHVGPGGLQAVAVGDLVIPTDPDGRVWLHYSRHDPARFVAAADVLGGWVGPDRFEGRLVLIGATAFGLSDYQATPISDLMTGVEIHAQFLEAVVDGTLLSRPALALWIEIGLLGAGGLLLVFALLAALSLGIASAFAALGAWLILPFAGLEVLLLGAAFWITARHATDYERIEVERGRVVVEVGEALRLRRYEMDARLARVAMDNGCLRLSAPRESLGSGCGSSRRFEWPESDSFPGHPETWRRRRIHRDSSP